MSLPPQELFAKQPKVYNKLAQKFEKECPCLGERRSRGYWDILMNREALESETGLRMFSPGKFMWEKEYYEWASTTPAGNLSPEESRRNWETWKSDPKHPTDPDGPRGFPMLWVEMGKAGESYQDMRKKHTSELVSKGKKKPNEKDMKTSIAMALSGHESHGNVDMQMRELFSKMSKGGEQQMFESMGLACSMMESTSIQNLLLSKHGPDAANDENPAPPAAAAGSPTSTPNTPSGVPAASGSAPPPPPMDTADPHLNRNGKKNVDVAMMRVKVIRTTNRLISNTHDSAVRTLGEGDAAIHDFENDPNSGNYKMELNILKTRSCALSLVVDKDKNINAGDLLKDFLANYGKDSKDQRAPGDHDETASTRSEDLALASAGPCARFLDLVLLSHVQGMVEELGTCMNIVDLSKCNEKIIDKLQVLKELILSCKTSVKDIYNARVGAKKDIEKAEKKEKLEREKRVTEAGAAAAKAAAAKQAGTAGQLPKPTAKGALFDHAPMGLEAMPTVTFEAFSAATSAASFRSGSLTGNARDVHPEFKFNPTQPLIITGVNWAKELIKDKDTTNQIGKQMLKEQEHMLSPCKSPFTCNL